jgi:NAD(P)-dependent dehydrogenase (short-subunit alcohol dehydrogenase family)
VGNATPMTDATRDQFSDDDPATRYDQPETDGQEIDHPGLTRSMDDAPDHGETSYRGTDRLVDKKAIVTGGDSGIGRAVALAFAREGADVLIAYLDSEEEDARETVRLVESAGRKAVTVPGDLQDEQHCRRVVDRAVEEFGQIDILVNNAAYQMAHEGGGIEEITTEQFDRVLKTNLYAMFWLTKFSLPHMPKGSSIINTSSVQASQPSPKLLDYAMTKAAIANFTKGLGQQLAERGIRVNAVAPGPVWTPLIPATMNEDAVASFGEQAPMGRAAQPAELAPAYVFFASAESSYITAEMLAVTGGSPITL